MMLEVKDLLLQQGDFTLGELSFVVEDQSYFVILGRTGSGKTMLLESIAGLQQIDGVILFDGVDITNDPPERRDFGFVYQDFALFEHLSVRKNILFSHRFKQIENADALFGDIVSFLQLGSLLDRKITHLSGGEKQRVAIARAIYSRPRLLLLDEPLSAVDPTFKTAIMKSLKQIVSRYGISIIHVTHNFREATYLADTIAVMLSGKILQAGKAQEVLNRPESIEVARFLGFKNILPASVFGFGEKERFLSINPNNILFSRIKQDKEHCFECTIRKILSQADYHKVIARIGELQIYAKISKNMFGKLDIHEGDRLYACIDSKDAVLI
jgi:molybdate/tungstate transport system ATP-binding protein